MIQMLPQRIVIKHSRRRSLNRTYNKIQPGRGRAPSYKFHKLPSSKGFCNTSKLKKVIFDQQSSKTLSGMPYREGDKGENGSKMPNITNLASTGHMISTRLSN